MSIGAHLRRSYTRFISEFRLVTYKMLLPQSHSLLSVVEPILKLPSRY